MEPNAEQYQLLNLLIQSAVALGTISVALVAIWGEQIKLWLGIGPKLTLRLSDPKGELIPDDRKNQHRYYHLVVTNEHKWAIATNTRVVVTSLAKPAADGTWSNRPLGGPVQLMWRFSDVHPLFSIVGPPDYCDFGYLTPGDYFRLALFVNPFNLDAVLHPNQRMRVTVKAIADNAESSPLSIEVSWDGQWADDTLEMTNHLVVKEGECSRIT